MQTGKELLTPEEVKRKLNVTTTTLWRWRKQGMPHEKFGPRIIRYNLDEIKAWHENKS